MTTADGKERGARAMTTGGKAAMKHRTTMSQVSGSYVWRCSCGAHDSHIGMNPRTAAAGAKRHRKEQKR